MSILGGVRDPDEFARRLAITVAALLVYRLGALIPLPGISFEALRYLGGAAIERISIVGLGIAPFLTVLIFAELAKILFPRLRYWEGADPRHGARLSRILVALAILVAAVQALGIAGALEDIASLVEEPGPRFRFACVATLAAGSAVVIWLADQITRHGLGSGAWLLLVTPWVADLPHRIAGVIVSWHDLGPTVPLQLLIGCVVAVLVLAAIVGLIQAGGDTLATAATCLWPALLAATAWPWLLLSIAVLAGGGSLSALAWLDPSHPFALLAFAGLVAAFTYLYLRSQRIAGAKVPAMPPAVAAGALAVIALADMVLATQLGWLVALAGHLIIIAVVALSLLARWWKPPAALAVQREEQL